MCLPSVPNWTCGRTDATINHFIKNIFFLKSVPQTAFLLHFLHTVKNNLTIMSRFNDNCINFLQKLQTIKLIKNVKVEHIPQLVRHCKKRPHTVFWQCVNNYFFSTCPTRRSLNFLSGHYNFLSSFNQSTREVPRVSSLNAFEILSVCDIIIL